MRLKARPWLIPSLSLAVALSLGSVLPVAAAPIATLTGESLSGSGASGSSPDCPSPTFSASGTATGPYAGTFTESGSWTGFAVPNTFTATFSITSGSTTVTGSVAGSFAGQFCDPRGTPGDFSAVPYTATIHTPTGDVHDEGVSGVRMEIFTSGAVLGFFQTFTSTVDADLGLSQPANLTVNATSPAGATVTYALPTVTDEDATGPTPSCAPGSGSTLAIGTTTVTCAATDSDDANSPVHTTFTVHVKGGAEQLSDLQAAVQGVGPGTSLADKVTEAQAFLAAGDLADTCGTLSAFIQEVQAQAGQSISAAEAQTLVATATRIQAVLGCG